MKIYASLILLGMLALPGTASAMPWDVGANAGFGAFFGTGWDANGAGGSLTVFGGPQLHEYISLHAALQLHDLHLRTEEYERYQGEFFALMVAPEVHFLGKRYGVMPYVTPLLGYSYTLGKLDDPGATVRYGSRAGVYGGQIGCVWPIARRYAIGANFVLLRMFGGQSCMKSDAGGTSCGALEENSTRLGAGQFTFRMSFGDP